MLINNVDKGNHTIVVITPSMDRVFHNIVKENKEVIIKITISIKARNKRKKKNTSYGVKHCSLN